MKPYCPSNTTNLERQCKDMAEKWIGRLTAKAAECSYKENDVLERAILKWNRWQWHNSTAETIKRAGNENHNKWAGTVMNKGNWDPKVSDRIHESLKERKDFDTIHKSKNQNNKSKGRQQGKKKKRDTLPGTDATANNNPKNLHVQVLWDESPTQTMASRWQDMQRMWKGKPLQGSM